MKWWYVVVLLVGVGLGWLLLDKYGVKTATKVTKVTDSLLQKERANLPRQMTLTKNGNRETVEIVGTVQSWDPDKGEIEFMSQNKIWKLSLDPAVALIYIPDTDVKLKVIKISDRNNINWKTAFCPGDEPVTFRLNSDNIVVLADNGGFRQCGFRKIYEK